MPVPTSCADCTRPARPTSIALGEAVRARQTLEAEGFQSEQHWQLLATGEATPPPLEEGDEAGDNDAGERKSRWQRAASSSRDNFAKTLLMLSLDRPSRALLRSQGGPASSHSTLTVPISAEMRLSPEAFQATLRRRLRLPLDFADAVCEGCGSPLDREGHHRASCMRSGRVKIRAAPVERTMARICREAGARVRERVRLKDLNAGVPANDEREIEMVASGLPCRRGRQLAVDVTLRSVLSASGQPKARAQWCDGAVASDARRDKERAYPELAAGDRCALVVVAVEAGGRFSSETCAFLRELAGARAEAYPRYLRASAAAAQLRRWSKMLSISVARALAESLLLPKSELVRSHAVGGRAPWVQDVLAEGRFDFPPACEGCS